MSSYKEDLERAEQDYSDCDDALMEEAEKASQFKKENAQLREQLAEARDVFGDCTRKYLTTQG
ncbi:hypothetical protein LCGC14_1670510, partial [marine sediment metagenome]